MFIKINSFKKIFLRFILFFVFFIVTSSLINGQTAVEHFYAAKALLKYNLLQKAEIELKKSIEIDENNAFFRIELGNLYYQNSRFSEAIGRYLSAEKIKSNSASFELSKVYSLIDNVDSSIFFLKKYLGYYKKISQAEIKNDSAFFNIQNSKEWNVLWTKNYYSVPQQMYQKAFYSYSYSDFTDALIETNLIIKKYKKFDAAYFLKAKILANTGNYEKSIKYFDKAISLNPRNEKYYIERAKSFVATKKYSNAISDLQKYFKLNPYDIDVYLLLANAYALNKEYEKSISILEYYTKFFYEDYEVFFQLAEVNYTAGNYLSTIKILNNLFDKGVENSKCFQLRALAYMNANSYELAYHDFSQCLDINPSLTDNYYYRGIVSLKLNKIENACSDWKMSLKNKDYRANEYFYKYCKDYQ